ncbi:MAG: hypothetical protein M3Q44_06790 [bacterium]|nr:hypothetical protein [bacterium]
MIEYTYTKWLYLVYLLFFPTSLFMLGALLLVLLSISAEKWAVLVVVLVLWFSFNLYLLLKIVKSKIVISADALIVITAFRTYDIPLSRIVAYKSYAIDGHRIIWGGAIRELFPLSGHQEWFEIHYKDFKGKKRFLREDITYYVNSRELMRNLDTFLKK